MIILLMMVLCSSITFSYNPHTLVVICIHYISNNKDKYPQASLAKLPQEVLNRLKEEEEKKERIKAQRTYNPPPLRFYGSFYQSLPLGCLK